MTSEQREFYDQNGYWIVRDLFESKDLETWKERLRGVIERTVEPAPDMLVMRDVMVAKGAAAPNQPAAAIAKIQDFHNDPVFFESYSKNPILLDWVEAVTGPDIKSIHSMLINKPPDLDGRHPLHQDLLYFPFRPADRIVATWTALEECNRENGCLVVVPGSHRGELLRHENPKWEYLNLGYFGVADSSYVDSRVHLEMRPGDTVFFHPLLIHGSGRNRSSGFRRAISCHYASAHCRFLPGADSVGNLRPYILVRGEAQAGCI
jgi:phytanoyl-CoA hydroxylase